MYNTLIPWYYKELPMANVINQIITFTGDSTLSSHLTNSSCWLLDPCSFWESETFWGIRSKGIPKNPWMTQEYTFETYSDLLER